MNEPTSLELEERKNSYEAGYITGWTEQQERIIKLLETKHFPESSMHSNRCPICKAVALITGEADYYEEETDWLDALIKGENK